MTNEDEFEYRKHLKEFFLEISDYQDSDAMHKINGSSPQYSSTSVLISIEFLMGEFELVVAEVYEFEF